MYFCAFMIVIICACKISAQNIETRAYHSLSPIKSDSAVIHFGASVVIKTSTTNSIAYVGAPTDGNKNGSVYKCSFNGKSYGNTSCSKYISFDNNAAIGMSIGADSSFSNLYICGNQHTTSCPTTPLQKRMVGACYKKPMTSSTATMFQTPCIPECPKIILIADIMFVLDESGSVDDTAFKSALNWIIKVISHFSSYIDSGDLRVGVYGFSYDDHRSGIRIRLQKWTSANLKKKIEELLNARSTGGGTYISYAIDETVKVFVADGRKSIAKEIILLTDGGASQGWKLKDAAKNARNKGIVLVSVGVGTDVNDDQLLVIAGNKARVFQATDYNTLDEVVNNVVSTIDAIKITVNLEGQNANSTNKLAECQLGSASHITKNNKMYVGAVGSYDRAGTVVDYSASAGSVSTQYAAILNDTDYATLAASKNHSNIADSYLGYSVTSGLFFGGNIEYVASGAPAYESRGMVRILFYKYVAIYKTENVTGSSSKYLLFLHPSETSGLWQLGAYFGHSVCAVDINKDSLDDLIVSAPLFNDVNGYDQGRVFVYINNKDGPQKWTSESYRPQSLSGSNAKGARFGMSVAVVGDVDLNGYDDIAVGAPSEGGTSLDAGVVYVYYVSSQGISETRKQRIVGKTVTSSLRNFGSFVTPSSSISNTDVDNNGYSDIVISASSSDRIIILRARPIVKVRTQITLNPPSIDLINCLSNSSAPCTSVTVCLTAFYTDDQVLTSPAHLNVTIDLDSKFGNPTSKRLVHSGTVFPSKTFIFNATSVNSCVDLQVQLRSSHFTSVSAKQETLDPPQVKMIYDYIDSYKNTIMSNVLDPVTSKVYTADWSFQKKCSGLNGSKCSHDLKVKTTYSVPPLGDPIILGSKPGLISINVTITNLGPDHSYFTRVNVTGNLDLNKVSGSCVTLLPVQLTNTTTVGYKASVSSVLDVMVKGITVSLYYRFGHANTKSLFSQCNFLLEYSLLSLTQTTETKEILLNGMVYSNVNSNLTFDPDMTNNVFKYRKKVLYATTLRQTSESQQSAIFYNRVVSKGGKIHNLSNSHLGEKANFITHKHMIDNRGPNIVAKASLVFTWPRQTKEGLPLLYLYHFQCLPLKTCNCSELNKVNEYGFAINNGTGANFTLNYDSNSIFPAQTASIKYFTPINIKNKVELLPTDL
ncbi:integrin alpha-M-like [Ciona intestinalis]